MQGKDANTKFAPLPRKAARMPPIKGNRRKYDVCAVAPKGGKDAANRGQLATTKTHEIYADRICVFCCSGEYTYKFNEDKKEELKEIKKNSKQKCL